MKKTYVKPDIVFESFMLCTSIATTCVFVAHSTPNSCPYVEEWDGEPISIFSSSMSRCDFKDDDGEQDPYDRICYHNPSSLNNVFGS